ncbi:MAG: SsrA-binding protein, partial [Microgenomates bacterium OLB23]
RENYYCIKKSSSACVINWNTKGNLTIVPLSSYVKKGFVKLELGLGKGRKTWEVKKVEQNRDETRRIQKELKEYLKS